MIMQILMLISTMTLVCSVDVIGTSTDCIAPPPCTCNDDNIDCFSLGLTKVPKFTVSTRTHDSLSVDLSRNQITKLSENAFFNLSTANTPDIEIDLANNSISEIEIGAFNGLKHTFRSLWVQDNDISVLSDALKGMSKLQVLNMHNNPIDNFDTGVFQTCGGSIEYLLFGGSSSYTWPTELRFMTKLKSLQFTGYNGKSIPESAFHPFHSTLTGLTIESSHLPAIPQAICCLSVLDFFVFTGNTYISDLDNLIPSCTTTLATVTSLELSNNELEEFPKVFNTFPNLTSLKVTGNAGVRDIEESVFTNIGLTSLDISNNSFTRIPQALSKLKHLPNLYIRQNRIKVLEKNQFPQTDMYLLDLSLNPIVSISDDAFDNVSSMITLMMDGVALSCFPKAVKHLTRLTSISFWDNRLICNCTMSWILSEWPHHDRVAITGNCSNIPITLNNYINQELPHCP